MPAGEKRGNDDEFDIAVNNYCANSQLLMPGEIFQEGELPVLEETDVHGEIGGVRELIREYIIHEKGGVISPEFDDNWKITGNDWDPALHQKVVEMLAAGELDAPDSVNGRSVKAITEDDLR